MNVRRASVPGAGAGALAVAALIALAGCGSSPAGTSGGPTTGTSRATTASTSATTSSGTTAATSSATTAGPTASPACTTRWLAATAERVPGSGAAGHYGVDIVLRNSGATPCTVRGFPGLSLVDAAGRQLGAAAGRDGASGATVTVPPGGTTRARVLVTQAANYDCRLVAATGFRVYPPDQTQSLLAAIDGVQGCADTTTPLLQVRAFGSG